MYHASMFPESAKISLYVNYFRPNFMARDFHLLCFKLRMVLEWAIKTHESSKHHFTEGLEKPFNYGQW